MKFLQSHPWIRTVYLYLFSLVGLVLVIIGAVRLLDLGLKIVIFKQADKPESIRPAPPYPPYNFEGRSTVKIKEVGEPLEFPKAEVVSMEEKAALDRWEIEYKNWQDLQSKIDYLRSRRESEASNSLAFMIIGVPLYLYHWLVIRRERKDV